MLFRSRLDAGRESVRRRFDDVVGLLERRGCVDGWALTDKGRVLARVFHEMDLLVVEAIARGHLDDLRVEELAASLQGLLRAGDVVLAMGAGNISAVAHGLPKQLSEGGR